MDITSESLAFWFLRLNGVLTIPNFVVHPEGPDASGQYLQRTDVDVLGVRFPNRIENRTRPMQDHEYFSSESRIHVVLAEVKTKRCALNESWRNPALENIQKILSAGGFQSQEHVSEAAASIYASGAWSNAEMVIRLVCLGSKIDEGLKQTHPDLQQFSWADDVLPFIFNRFKGHHLEKRMNGQWQADGIALFEQVLSSETEDEFVQSIVVTPP